MGHINLELISPWLQHVDNFLPLFSGIVSIVILLGCAVATWLSPAEDEDCLFHREVY